MNLLGKVRRLYYRDKPSPPPTQVETHLEVNEAPIADTVRYDGLRVEVSHA